jgi:hypothetical protein
MAEIITRTFEMSLGHHFRQYADWLALRERRAVEAARDAPATVVAAKGRALRAGTGAVVRARVRPAAAPCVFRALRPGDQIVTPPSLTTSTRPASPRTIPPEPESVGAVLARRQARGHALATWLRGDGPGASAARNVSPGAAPVPTARAITRAEPEPLADVFARRRAVVQAARPYMVRED